MILMQGGSGIGQRILNWLQLVPGVKRWSTWWANAQQRSDETWPFVSPYLTAALANFNTSSFISTLQATVLYVVTGWSVFDPQKVMEAGQTAVSEAEKFQENPSVYLAEKLRELTQSSGVQEMTELVGSIITEPVLTLFENYAGQDNADPHEFSRAFHGYMISLGWAGGILDATLKVPLGDRAPSVSNALNSMYWSLGLGFLGWQTLAPVLSSGLQPPLERYYKKLYRPERFNPNEMRDLLALGEIGEEAFREAMREQGWKDSDISTWLKLKYRTLSEGTVWKLREDGHMTDPQVEERLHQAGYDPNDIPWLFKAHPLEETEETGKYLASTAKAAYKSGLIDVSEFRDIMRTLGRNDREIEIELQLLDQQNETELKELTVSQIRGLYVAGLIDTLEAKHHLSVVEISPQAQDNLIRLWDNESVPKAVRLNRGTITEAYREGVIDRSRASTLLQQESGYNSEQAEIILKTQDAIIERVALGVAQGPAAISLAMLRDFALAGLISRGEAEARTELEKFAPADRPLVVDWLFFGAFEQPLELGVDALGEAYVFGLLTREELEARVLAKGVLAEDVEIFIREIELNNPEVFGEFTPRFVAVPSVGQLDKALVRGILSEDEYRTRLSKLGFTPDGIDILLFNAQYQTPKEPKRLSDARVLDLYEKGKITRPNALDRLVGNGYILEDAQLLIEGEEIRPEDTEAAQWYFSGYLELGPLLAIFTELGYSPEEIQDFVDNFT